MSAVHRDTDSRSCGASTITAQSSSVYVNGLLWSIDADPDSDGGGALSAAVNQVYIGGTMVVNVGDSAAPDDLCIPLGGAHCGPNANGGSTNVFVGD